MLPYIVLLIPLQICDPKLHLKQSVPLREVTRLSVSSQNDHAFVVHIALSDPKKHKGDVIMVSDR